MLQGSVQMLISGAIFTLVYIFIIIDKIDRTLVALSGAALMIITGILSQENAFREVDYNTLGLLISMMIIVMITRRTGVFEFLAIKTIKLANGEPWKILILMSIITGLLSALLDNVTTVLLVLPLTFSMAKDLHINPVPFIISEVFASNIGGTATLIGDPPNIMIGSFAKLSFMDFIKNETLIVLLMLFITTYLFVLIYKKKLHTTEEAKSKVMEMNEYEAIRDRKLLIKSIIVIFLTMVGFVLHSEFGLESATVAIIGAIILLLSSGIHPEKIFKEVEWKTIFFFVGLFIIVGGIKQAGIIDLISKEVLNVTHGDLMLTTMAILWVSAIASAFIDNIPFVATMLPMIKDLGTMSGMNLTPIWWALSFGACLGGNGTIIGASANVVACSMADEHGHKITFKNYFKIAFPVMLVSVAVSTIYLYVFYLV